MLALMQKALQLRTRTCRRCGTTRPLSDFHVYKYGDYAEQRRWVCGSCCNVDTIRWRQRQGCSRRVRVANTPDLRNALLFLRDYYGSVSALCYNTGITKSAYHRIIRDEVPRVYKTTADSILQHARDITRTSTQHFKGKREEPGT